MEPRAPKKQKHSLLLGKSFVIFSHFFPAKAESRHCGQEDTVRAKNNQKEMPKRRWIADEEEDEYDNPVPKRECGLEPDSSDDESQEAGDKGDTDFSDGAARSGCKRVKTAAEEEEEEEGSGGESEQEELEQVMMEAFNMDRELRTGDFDASGNYVSRGEGADEDEADDGLVGLDSGTMERARLAEQQRVELVGKREREREARGQQDLELAVRRLAVLLPDHRTPMGAVLQVLNRDVKRFRKKKDRAGEEACAASIDAAVECVSLFSHRSNDVMEMSIDDMHRVCGMGQKH